MTTAATASKRWCPVHRARGLGKPAFTTQLFFPDDPRNTNDAAYRPELLMKIADGRGGRTAAFDIVLNI